MPGSWTLNQKLAILKQFSLPLIGRALPEAQCHGLRAEQGSFRR